jgi:hypothetical protein
MSVTNSAALITTTPPVTLDAQAVHSIVDINHVTLQVDQLQETVQKSMQTVYQAMNAEMNQRRELIKLIEQLNADLQTCQTENRRLKGQDVLQLAQHYDTVQKNLNQNIDHFEQQLQQVKEAAAMLSNEFATVRQKWGVWSSAASPATPDTTLPATVTFPAPTSTSGSFPPTIAASKNPEVSALMKEITRDVVHGADFAAIREKILGNTTAGVDEVTQQLYDKVQKKWVNHVESISRDIDEILQTHRQSRADTSVLERWQKYQTGMQLFLQMWKDYGREWVSTWTTDILNAKQK